MLYASLSIAFSWPGVVALLVPVSRRERSLEPTSFVEPTCLLHGLSID